MGAGFSDHLLCCTRREKEQTVPLSMLLQHSACKATGASGCSGQFLTCNAAQVVALDTSPKGNAGAHDGQAVDCCLQDQPMPDASVGGTLVLATSLTSHSKVAEDMSWPSETTTVETETSTDTLAKETWEETEGSWCMSQVKEVAEYDDALTHWYSSPESRTCNNASNAGGQEAAQQARANRSLSNWYIENICVDVAPSPTTDTVLLPVLRQAPCHYYNLSSFVDESAISSDKESLGDFRLIWQTQVKRSVSAMNMWHPVAPCHML